MERVLKVAIVAALLAAGAVTAQADPTFRVDGLGFFGDRRMQNLAWTLRSDDMADDHLNVAFIENALFMIDARLEAQGHLRPRYAVEVRAEGDETARVVEWNGEDLLDLPTELRAAAVRVQVDKGTFYRYAILEFNGLHALPEDDARDYFFTERFLLFRESERVFSPSGMQGSARSLASVLRGMGYQNATVQATAVNMNHETGDVAVRVVVDEGLEHRVRQVAVLLDGGYRRVPGVEGVTFNERKVIDEAFSLVWQQDYGRSILHKFYEAGYPQAEARFVVTQRETRDNRIFVDGELHVQPGPRVQVGEVTFEGRGRTRSHVLNRRVDSSPGNWLNPLQLDEDRYRLAQLGIFDEVHVFYGPAPMAAPPGAEEPPVLTRDIRFDVELRKRLNVDLLLGYGSYDQLRGGIEITRENLWGRAHSDQLLLVQSFVSTLVEYRYRLPEFFDINNDVTARLRWLRREEISFLRREFGGEIRLTRPLESIEGANVSVGYRLQRVEALGLETEEFLSEARIGSLLGNFSLDRLDNPIFPEEGWQVRVEAQAGARLLGGEVDFQRLQTHGSYHRRLGSTTLFHAALGFGVVGSLTEDSGSIPVSERFFPGGEDSIRGYTEGEASPVNAAGEQIGAESFLQPTVEVEQFVTKSFSGVVFADGLLISDNWDEFLAQDFMLSLGVGVRYRTIVGPVRLEAGYNVIRRDFDPSWTLHLSLGYPF